MLYVALVVTLAMLEKDLINCCIINITIIITKIFLYNGNQVKLPIFLSEWQHEFLCLQAVQMTITNTA